MILFSRLRKPTGAVMALVITCLLLLALTAVSFFYIIETFSGDKQLCNATDAGALAGAQQILSVNLTKDQVKSIPNVPQEFLSLGVKPDGTVDQDSSTAIFDIRAYNNCASYTTYICLNAAASGTTAAITSANAVIAALNAYAFALNEKMQDSTSSSYPGTAATNFMANNPATNLAAALLAAHKLL